MNTALNKLQEVRYPQGRFADGSGPKLIMAPFQIAHLDGIESACLMPGTFEDATANVDQELFFMRESPPLDIGEHEMGDFMGQPDNWRGVHQFSRI